MLFPDGLLLLRQFRHSDGRGDIVRMSGRGIAAGLRLVCADAVLLVFPQPGPLLTARPARRFAARLPVLFPAGTVPATVPVPAPVAGRHLDGGEHGRIDGILRQAVTDELLDLHDRIGIFFADEADGLTAGARPGGPADAVNVVFGVLGQIIVEHMTDRGNVQAAGGDIGGHQDPLFSLLELGQQLFPFFLGDIAGQGCAFDAVDEQCIGDIFRGMARVDEDEHPVGSDLFQLVDQQRQLFLVAWVVAGFHHLVRNHLVAVHLDFHRTVHVLEGQFHHAIGQGGGIEQVQPLVCSRHPAQQIPDVPDESEIKHPVRFIQYGYVRMLEGEQVLAVEVDQASRGADQDVVVPREHVLLLFVAGTAVN